MAQARWYISDGNLANERYRYYPLWPGSIRLLRVMPHQNETAVLQCQIFDYPLHSSEGTHMYEALSYVWGDSHHRHAISVDGQDLFVTTNLYAALVRLRDRFLERILWVDAICINQDDNEEKGKQIRYMAEIYSKAYRVTVWLGEAEGDGERALEVICHAAAESSSAETTSETPSEALFDESTKKAIRLLLQRPWFKRIWVLQEVAAARNILIKCGSTEIDGYAFSEALSSQSFDRFYEDSPGLQRLVGSITYLIRGAAFRPKRLSKPSSRFSLCIRSLGELIEMYCTREASERHDKVFALLGMSSDDPIAAGLSPDYGIPWEGLLERLIRYLLGEQVAVKTWPVMELAVIRSKGLLLGYISRISSKHVDRDNRQQVAITLVYAYGTFYRSTKWSLPPVAESVEVGDLVCLLGKAASPTIIRPQKDHFSVIMIATPPLQITHSNPNVLRDFLLVWDWEKSRDNSRRGQDDMLWMESRIPEHLDRDVEGHFDGMTAWEMALISEDGGKYEKAEAEFQEIIGGYEARFGEVDSRTLMARERLLSIYQKTARWPEAMKLAEQLIQTRIQFLGRGHPETARSRATLASIYGHPNRLRLDEQQLEVIGRIIERRDEPMTEHEVEEIAKSCEAEQMELLLNQRGDEVRITEAVLIKAVDNQWYGEAVVELLLDRGGDAVRVTEAVLVKAAGNPYFGDSVMTNLLDRVGEEVKITEGMLMEAAGNEHGVGLMKVLLERGGDEVKITEAVLVKAAGNPNCGMWMMRVLLERGGDEVKITEAVLVKAAENPDSNWDEGRVMNVLLERGGEEVKMMEAMRVKTRGGV